MSTAFVLLPLVELPLVVGESDRNRLELVSLRMSREELLSELESRPELVLKKDPVDLGLDRLMSSLVGSELGSIPAWYL